MGDNHQNPIGLDLADVIEGLRTEIDEALQRADGQNTRFELKDVELEFQTVISKQGEAAGKGKIKFWLFDVDAELKGSLASVKTHKINLRLTPFSADSTDSDRKSKIALGDAE